MGGERLTCAFCGIPARSWAKMDKHLATAHPVFSAMEDDMKKKESWGCALCGLMMETKAEEDRHVATVHTTGGRAAAESIFDMAKDLYSSPLYGTSTIPKSLTTGGVGLTLDEFDVTVRSMLGRLRNVDISLEQVDAFSQALAMIVNTREQFIASSVDKEE